MNRISFFTPVYYEDKPKSTKEFLLEKVDAYFYLGGRRARVIVRTEENSQEVDLVADSPSMLTTSIKIASYFTIVIPLIILTAKVFLRSSQEFHVVTRNPQNSVFMSEGFHLSNESLRQVYNRSLNRSSDFTSPTPNLNLPLVVSRPAISQNDELYKNVIALVVQENYNTALALLNRETSLDTSYLRRFVEISKQGAKAIKLIENLNIGEGLFIIKGLEKSYTKDDILKEAIKKLALKKFFEQAVDLLDQPFYSSYNRESTVKGFAKVLNLDTGIFEDDNRIKIAKFFLKKKEYVLSAKLVKAITDNSYDKRDLLTRLSPHLLSLI